MLHDAPAEHLARDTYEIRLTHKHLVSAGFTINPEHPPTLSKLLSPKRKQLTADQWEIVAFAINVHRDTIRDLILTNGLFEAQAAARAAEVKAGHYERVPGIAYGTIEYCDRTPKEQLALRVSHVAEGWALLMTVDKGRYPDLDNKTAQLQAAVDLRNQEVRDYIAQF